MVHIRLKSLNKTFSIKDEVKTAFKDIDFEVKKGEFIAIVGPSGCGKTTLLRAIAGLEQASSGDIQFEQSGQNVAMIFQEHGLFPWMSLSDNIQVTLDNNKNISKSEISSISEQFMQVIGLSDFVDYLPHQVSGGMRQRVNIARAFANKPDVLLMDEPFVFLDYQTRLSLHELLLSIWEEQKQTVIFVTHDIEEAVLLADRVFVISSGPGQIIESYNIDLDRPRDYLELRQDVTFNKLVTDILRKIKVQTH